jgi:hypothetical protein
MILIYITDVISKIIQIIRKALNGSSIRYIVLVFLANVAVSMAQAQFYPVQITTQLVPPYSVYLPDYATPGNDKLRLVMVQRDLTKPSYQIRLQLSVELNGRTILRTARTFNPPPINLDPGIPTVITGIDLQPYLDSHNLDFVGYSKTEYEQTKALPEGSYQICFTAYDYRRQDVQVSESGCNFYWLAKDEPPLINFPACGMSLAVTNPQQIIFSWLPRNTSSPNSAAQTEYEFSLFEMRPSGRNPNDVVLSSSPIYRTTTEMTQLVYGPAEPFLLENLTYVWRVRAIDKNGKDQFRNNGYSEVCTFNYGAADAIQWQPIADLQAEAETERRGKAWWGAQQVDGYKVHYKKVGSSHQWFSQDADKSEVVLFDLEADTRYEVRVQPQAGGVYGPYSDIKEFKTLTKRTFQCGDQLDSIPALGNPLPFATMGMMIDVQGIIMTIKEVDGPHGAGLYSGLGEVSIPYFGGAVFNVTFNNLYINENRMAQQGRVEFITKGVDAFIEEELAEQKRKEREEQQQKNREEWAGTDFYSKIFYYEEIEIDSMYTNAEGHVIIVDASGATYVNKEIPAILADAPEKAIIIEDKNGDQWVVQKDGKVTRVPAGGLSPTMDVVVSEEALDMVKQALQELHLDYSGENFAKIERELTERRTSLDAHIEQHNSSILQNASASSSSSEEEELLGEPLFFDFVLTTPSEQTTDDEFKQLSLAKNDKELERNRGVLLGFLGNDTNVNEANKLVAQELEIESRPVSEFIEKKKQSNTPLSEIKAKVKEAIVALIDSLLIEAAKKKNEQQ